jgi:hypothetical protein
MSTDTIYGGAVAPVQEKERKSGKFKPEYA